MKTMGLFLGVLLPLLFAVSGILATNDYDLDVYKNGHYYQDTCLRTWGTCPDYSIRGSKDIYLGTDERRKQVAVGFGIFSNCDVDLSDYNQLQYGAKIVAKGGLDTCALRVKIELQDSRNKTYPIYHWITDDYVDYSTVLSRFRCPNLNKIQGLFLLTAFDVISYSDSKEVVLVIDYIRYVNKPTYSVFDDCSDYQFEGKYNGPNSLFYWPGDRLKVADVRSKCEGYERVLAIPCDIWGGGFLGYAQDLSGFKYLTFWLKSTVKTKIEIKDDHNQNAYFLPATKGKWKLQKIPLEEFCDVDLTNVTWQFKITKVGSATPEVLVADIRYTC